MRNSLLLLLIVSVLSCTTEKRNEIPLFNEVTFILLEGENIVDIKPAITERYFSHFINHSFQIPLFRYIENSNYEIFIGIPYGTSIKKLINSQLINQDSSLIDSKSDSVSYYFKKHEKKSSYITEYAVNFENNLIYILSVTNSKEVSDSLFNYFELSERFDSKKE